MMRSALGACASRKPAVGVWLAWLATDTSVQIFRSSEQHALVYMHALGLIGSITLSRWRSAAPGQEAGGVALGPLVFATVASCLLEAATTQLDNIFLPLHHLAMLAA